MRPDLRAYRLAVAVSLLLLPSCLLVRHSLKTGGEQQLAKTPPPPAKSGPHVIIFALDGAVPQQLMEAIHSGKAPNIARLLGKDEGGGLFEHAYAAPNALSVLPSSTIADWASVFTGKPPAQHGAAGDEWFDRETATFYAPVPVSLTDIADNTKTVADDLVGSQLKAPTLYELLGKSHERIDAIHPSGRYLLHNGASLGVRRSSQASGQRHAKGS
jgi:Type I phosphodiesterase / nucleotide pyrophosphatase